VPLKSSGHIEVTNKRHQTEPFQVVLLVLPEFLVKHDGQGQCCVKMVVVEVAVANRQRVETGVLPKVFFRELHFKHDSEEPLEQVHGCNSNDKPPAASLVGPLG